MATDNIVLSTNIGTGATARTLADSSGNQWANAVVCYATTISPGANVLQEVMPAFPLPVTAVVTGSVAVTGTFFQTTQPVSLASSVAVTGTFWQTTQPVSGTFWQATQPVSGTFWQATQPVSGTVTANQGSTWSVVVTDSVALTVTGTVAATQSGTWTNTVTQATAASLNATVVGTGTFAVQVSAALPAGTNVIGHVIVDSGTITTVSAVTAITNALPAGTNSIGTVQLGNTPNTTPVLANKRDVAATTGNITVIDSGTSSATGQNGVSIITGAPTAASSVSATATGQTSMAVQVMGTWTGTLSFERSIDGGTTWVPTSIHLLGSSGSGTTYAGSLSSVTANFVGHTEVGANTQIRIRATATMTGTAAVTMQPGFGVGLVAASQAGTNSVYAATLASTPLYAKISLSATGTVVAAVSGKQIVVLRWSASANGNVNINWQSHTTTSQATGLHYMTQYASAGGAFCPVGIFATVAGEALDLALSASIAVGGEITYILV